MPNRIIKESVWVSASLAKVSLAAQSFWLRLLPLPDDHGCFDARSAVLRGRLYPLCLDKVSEAEIEVWMKELESVDCIRRWMTSNDSIWGYVPKWADHQRIRALHQRKTPPPPDAVLANSFIPIDFTCRQVPSNDGLNHSLVLTPTPQENTKDIPAENQKPAASKENFTKEQLEQNKAKLAGMVDDLAKGMTAENRRFRPRTQNQKMLDEEIKQAQALYSQIFGKHIRPSQIMLLANGQNGKRFNCFGSIPTLMEFWKDQKKDLEDPFLWSKTCGANSQTVARYEKRAFEAK